MVCKKVLSLLSEFMDEALDAEVAAQVSQHLHQCIRCRAEYETLSTIQARIKSLRGVQVPEHLHTLVHHRIADMKQNSWSNTLRYELERRWSLIRTTETIWYVTRAVGTVMTALFFFLISSTAISPLYLTVDARSEDRGALTLAYGKQVSQNVLANLGMGEERAPRQPQVPVSKNNPAINDLYFLKFEEGNSPQAATDTLTVVTTVDSSGGATIQNVLEYPNNKNLLIKFNEMISSAKCRPASHNGKAVSSDIVMTYSTVSVYD